MIGPRARIHHHFTVDVEEYFQVVAMEPYVERREWDGISSRVDIGTRQLLDLLDEQGATGTFFTLGWIGRKHPGLVRDIVARGHEMASHGWGHERVTTLTREQFRESVRSSRAELEQLTGQRVQGYRAPSFSIIRGGEWAFDILIEEGYTYDSSLMPILRSGYGYRGGARDPYSITRNGGVLREFPPTTLGSPPVLLPAGGGAYFRLFPYEIVKLAFLTSERRGVPGTFYIHPWELDPDQPRVPVSWKTRIRHYGGLRKTVPRLRTLLRDFAFQSIATTLAAPMQADQARPLAS
jgi:polysaccharide deacetylase family protein (PEP-CTERM system associated)